MAQEYIEHITYINLDKRGDRRAEIEQQLTEYNFNAERFSAIEMPNLGIYGCGMSHLSVLKDAKSKGYKYILILEDDFVFLVDRATFNHELQKLYDSNIYFDVCMISYLLIQSEECDDAPFLYRVREAQTASGYIVSCTYYDTLIQLYETNMPLLLDTQSHWLYANDQCWKELQKKDKWYCFKTRIGKQRDGYSDNSQTFRSYEC